MISIHRLSARTHPIQAFADAVTTLPPADRQTVAVVPTSRNVKALTHRLGHADITPLTVSDFWRYALVPEKPPVPEELRIFALSDAVNRLTAQEREGLFKHADSEFFDNFTAFAESGGRILSFLAETARELVSIDELTKLSVYTDFAPQMAVVSRIGELYRQVIAEAGLLDPAVSPDKLSPDIHFAGRTGRVALLAAGILTRHEMASLTRLDEAGVDVHVFFHYADAKHPASAEVQAMLGSPVPDAPPPPAPRSVSIVATDTALDQIELITRRAVLLHHRDNVPYERMAVILPDDSLAGAFMDRDPLRLFNVSGGVPLMRVGLAGALAHAVTVCCGADDGSWNVKELLELTAFDPVSRMPGVSAFATGIEAAAARGRISVTPGDASVPPRLAAFLAPAALAEDTISPATAARKLATMLAELPPLPDAPDEDALDEAERTRRRLETDARAGMVRTLDRLSRSLSKVPAKTSRLEAFSHVLSILAKIRLHHPGGPVTVMEVLEARNMQFEAVFVPNMLEGSFPPRSDKDLFLNTEIRIQAGLPTASMRERLAVNFLEQVTMRAAHVTYSYPAGREYGVASRVVQQLAFGHGIIEEHFRFTDPLSYSTDVPFAPHRLPKHQQVPVAKSEKLLRVLKDRPIHSGMLNDYLTCPLKFCYRYLVRLKPPEAPADDIPARDLSSDLHDVMAGLVKDGISPLSKDYADELHTRFIQKVSRRDAYRKNPAAAFNVDALAMRLPELAEAEAEWAKQGWKPVSAETSFTAPLAGRVLTGRADRIDRRGEEFAVIDYKMRTVSPLPDKPEKAGDMQMPVYGILLAASGVAVNRYVHVDVKDAMGYAEVFSPGLLPAYTERIAGIIEEMVNPELVFTKTESRSRCAACEFIELCERG